MAKHDVLGQGVRVFEAAPVRGTVRVLDGPDDVLDLMDTGAGGVIALVADAGATFLAPLFGELAGIVCSGGTPASHIGIVSRDFQVPCLVGTTFESGPPEDGTEVTVDCSADPGVVRG